MERTRMLLLSPLLALALIVSGCGCKRVESTPHRPQQIRGWHEAPVRYGIISVGEFVIDKDHPVEGEKLGIALIGTSPAMACSDPWAEPPQIPQAMIRFYRVSDKSVLLEIPVHNGASTRLINFKFPTKEYGVDTVFIHEINTKDEWVWLDVRK